ncbi:MAG TPA: helix-turn-helix domain-containing GNAT family N-acetyltransferase [Candidatus Limnocylindria bacterium]|jgi:GNAT superfamily N-acetyltransferase
MRDLLTIEDPAAIPVLYDPLRNRIFRLLRRPRSIPELAAELDLPADRLYYHVNRLVEYGLVRQAGTRSRGRHVERVFERTSARIKFEGDVELGGVNPLTAIAEELGAGLVAAMPDDVASVSYHLVTITPERAATLADRLRTLIEEYDDPTPEAASSRYAVLGAIAPMRQPDDERLTIRELRSDELGFLKEMLYAALAWRPGVALPPIEWVLAHPQVSVFHADWGRPGDVALVAEEGGHLVGLVWYRLFSEDSHGEGFIDAETPELAIAVADGHRGRGIGRRLMEAAGERARADRIARLSLSVDEGNPARHLYTALGYVEFVADDGLGRMVLDLEPQAG